METLNHNLNKRENWSFLNLYFAIFLFLSFLYPMPTRSLFAFITFSALALLFFAITIDLFMRHLFFYYNSYIVKITLIFLLLMAVDFFCVLYFGFDKQMPYLIGRFAFFLIFIVGVSFHPSIQNVNKLIKIYCLSMFILAILTIAHGFSWIDLGIKLRIPRNLFGFTMPFKKNTGVNISDGEFGLMMVPAFLFFLMQFMPKSGIKPHKMRLIMAIATGLAILISQSRSTLLGLAVSLLTLIFILLRKKKSKIIFVVLTVLILVILFYFTSFLDNFLGEGRYRLNVSNRVESFKVALRIFFDNPIIGVGHGNAVYMLRDRVMVVHNQILDQLASTGIIGGIPLIMLYLIFFTTAFKLYSDPKLNSAIKGLVLWIIVAMVHSLVELMLYRGFYAEHLAWYFAVLGLLYSVQYGYRKIAVK